jgi:hypothetical protein
MVFTSGFSFVGGSFGASGGLFDKTVRSCGVLQDYVYFAGDFTTPNNNMGNDLFNGLVRSQLNGIESGTHDFDHSSVHIYTHNKQLYVEYEAQAQPVQLRIYDMQGQVILQQQLAAGAIAFQEDLTSFSDGVYLYDLSNGKQRVVGKLSLF